MNTGETRIEGAKREFEEESGWTVDIKEVRDLGHCRVCAGILGDRISADHEMTVRLFA